MQLRSVRTVHVSGKRTLVVAELNVARDSQGRVIDDTRIRAVIPTILLLVRRGAKVIIATHRGRPHGRVVPSLSTKTILQPLARALKRNVQWVSACTGEGVARAVHDLPRSGIVLLENTRFNAGDEENKPAFARALAANADIFVLESFGTAHRRHASIVGVARFLPAYAGLRFVKEVDVLSRLIAHPRHPTVAILGGAKISTKLGLITRLLKRYDALLLGGALANVVLKAKGIQIGASLVEPNVLNLVRDLDLANPHLHIPIDVIVRGSGAYATLRPVGRVRKGEAIVDIGPDTVELFAAIIRRAGTVIWNGPMGIYEERPFDRGTLALARTVAASSAFSVVGGGETVDAVRHEHLEQKMNFISTGGGAMMEFLEGKRLPGVEVVKIR